MEYIKLVEPGITCVKVPEFSRVHKGMERVGYKVKRRVNGKVYFFIHCSVEKAEKIVSECKKTQLHIEEGTV